MMRTVLQVGLALLTVALVLPWLPVWGQETETVTVQRKPVDSVEPVLPGGLKEGLKEETKEPWLGVSIKKPTMAAYAQLPKVPRGTGFVLDRISKGGPADLAGLERYDFLWKLDDQLLMNEPQFLALLQLRAVGDLVRLTFSRGGESHEVTAILVDRPENEKGRERADCHVIGPRIPGLPHHRVVLQSQTAELRDGKETVHIQRMAGQFKWAVFDKFGLEMMSGELVSGADEDFPPEVNGRLKDKLQALIRSLEDAELRGRQGPRVRRVPSPKEGKS